MQDALEQPVCLRIASTSAHLPIVRAAVGRLCRMVGFEEEVGDMIVLAVDEALANVIKHAYQGDAGKPIEITFCRVRRADGPGALQIELRDWGTQVPPESIRSRDLADVRPGGLGVHIIHSIMDKVQYVAEPEGGTRLTMTKAL